MAVHKFIYRQGIGENTVLCAQDDGIQTTVSTDWTNVTCAQCLSQQQETCPDCFGTGVYEMWGGQPAECGTCDGDGKVEKGST